MKKVFITLISILLLAGITFAKGNMAAGANAGIAIPLGDFGTAFNLGYGGSGIFMYKVNDALGVTGSVGYLRFSGDNDISFSTVPVLFGGRYHFGKGKIIPYAAAELGLFFSNSESPVTTFKNPITNQTTTIGGGSVSSTDFGFGLGGGALFAVSKTVYIDGNVKFNIITTSGSTSTYITIMAGVLAAI